MYPKHPTQTTKDLLERIALIVSNARRAPEPIKESFEIINDWILTVTGASTQTPKDTIKASKVGVDALDTTVYASGTIADVAANDTIPVALNKVQYRAKNPVETIPDDGITGAKLGDVFHKYALLTVDIGFAGNQTKDILSIDIAPAPFKRILVITPTTVVNNLSTAEAPFVALVRIATQAGATWSAPAIVADSNTDNVRARFPWQMVSDSNGSVYTSHAHQMMFALDANTSAVVKLTGNSLHTGSNGCAVKGRPGAHNYDTNLSILMLPSA